jgi:hypothetical protein
LNWNENSGSAVNNGSCTYDGNLVLPAASTRTGYTFAGWKLANGTIKAAGSTVTGGCTYANTGVYSGTSTSIVAQWTARTDTAYVVNHYTKNLGATSYTLNNTQNLTGTTDASLTLANLKIAITGFTYSKGFAGTTATGTTMPSSGAVTTTTILADGTRVINLYYTRDSYVVALSKGTGIASVSGAGTYEYGASVTLGATMNNGYDWVNWTKTGTTTQVSATNAYNFTMPAGALDYTANAKVHSYSITYDLNDVSGSANPAHGTTHPSSYKITDTTFTISDPTMTGYTFGGWTIVTAPTAWGTGSSSDGATSFKVATGTYGDIKLKAKWTAKTDTAYKVNHYLKDLGATSYTLKDTISSTGTTDATLTLANLKRSYTGFTYGKGFAGTAATGTTMPSSGAVTTTTVLADGTRIINLYYTRDTHTVTLTKGTGIASVSGAGTY